jgi:hypothetical protein
MALRIKLTINPSVILSLSKDQLPNDVVKWNGTDPATRVCDKLRMTGILRAAFVHQCAHLDNPVA